MPLTVGANLAQRHHRANSDATKRKEPAESLQQGGPDVVLRREPVRRREI
jgi:hypothetical protein